MVDVVSKSCAHGRCAKKPSFGVNDGEKTEFCSKHAKAEMLSVRSGRRPSSGIGMRTRHDEEVPDMNDNVRRARGASTRKTPALPAEYAATSQVVVKLKAEIIYHD